MIQLAANSENLPESGGEVFDMGCRERTAPPKLRRRLIARDHGCAHPDGGLTTEENMVLRCAHHHTLIHNTDWQVRITKGKPEFTPPEYRPFHCGKRHFVTSAEGR
ncbi:hypothetical protein [Sciscionella marina]|uniref:hypothetical protein n=1 Tax=Sciscionella marina TaxID=508770 RepID=UPI0003A05468|nr:hypothetical protein [Sciscionella marina]